MMQDVRMDTHSDLAFLGLLCWTCQRRSPEKRRPHLAAGGGYGVLEDDTALLKHRDTRFAHLRGRSEG